MKDAQGPSISYKDAGVDIDAGNALVKRIKHVAESTRRPEVVGGVGGFGAICKIPSGYKEPLLVSATDGVGTKLRLAIDLGRHNTVGIDLVAMCVNDLIVCGAEPLFFLDYYATGKLNVDIAAAVIEGIGNGCKLAGCSLVGGETAEMPGMYAAADYDLAGFSVGVVEAANMIDGSKVASGDVLIGLASSGPHANGFSLIRKILSVTNTDPLSTFIETKSLADILLAPTRIYVDSLRQLSSSTDIHAIAHITGGGLLENIPRVLPAYTRATIDTNSWKTPEIFDWLQLQGNISSEEMFKTFNCGIGMVLCIAAENCAAAVTTLESLGEAATVIGSITATEDPQASIELTG